MQHHSPAGASKNIDVNRYSVHVSDCLDSTPTTFVTVFLRRVLSGSTVQLTRHFCPAPITSIIPVTSVSSDCVGCTNLLDNSENLKIAECAIWFFLMCPPKTPLQQEISNHLTNNKTTNTANTAKRTSQMQSTKYGEYVYMHTIVLFPYYHERSKTRKIQNTKKKRKKKGGNKAKRQAGHRRTTLTPKNVQQQGAAEARRGP